MLSACASAPPFVALRADLETLRGRPIEEALERLGSPSEEKTVEGKQLVVWSRFFKTTRVSYSSSTLFGPTTAATVIPYVRQESHDCMIRLIVSDEGLIEAWEQTGDRVGCKGLAKALKGE